MRKEDLKLAGNLYLRTILAAAAAFFVFICLEFVFSAVFARRTGFSAVAVYSDGSRRSLGVYDTVNIDEVYDALEQLGYDVNEDGVVGDGAPVQNTAGVKILVQEQKETPPAADVVCRILSQTCMVLLFGSMLYTKMWECGDKHRNAVQFDRAVATPWYGLRVGALAAIPSATAFLALVGSKLGLWAPTFVQYYRYCHFAFYPLYLIVVPNEVKLTADLDAWRFLPLLGFVLALPLIAAVSYWLGTKQILLSERLIYVNPKKKKKHS